MVTSQVEVVILFYLRCFAKKSTLFCIFAVRFRRFATNNKLLNMKRFTMILALLLMAAIPMMAERVTPEVARKVTTTFLNNNGVKSSQLVDLSEAVGFQNLYIFNGNPGFVVMSADDCVKPILGYSLTGVFIAEDMPENVRGWLQGYNDEIQYAMDNNMRAEAETSKLWKELAEGKDNIAKASTVVAPLIQTKWNQNQYYNDLCPLVSDGPEGHAYTGCVATAMAQIMKYWEYPSHGIGSHSYTWSGQTLSANFGETTYDWNNMQLCYNYYYETGTGGATWISAPTQAQLSAVTTLMYHCGVSVNMNYGGYSTGGSGAQTSAVAIALKTYFNYSSEIVYKEKKDYDDNVWITMVKAELDANRPLQYKGRSSGGGHSFVCDGYNSDNKFHFNWGWSGAYDGYFSLDNLNTGANNQSGQGNGTYTDDQAALFGIQPAQCLADAPSNLTYTMTGIQNITLNWTAASGAASYNIYCNNNFVGNSTTNTYTGMAPFGTSFYWVRSVDANGELSLASNSVTVTVAYQTPIVDDLEGTFSGNNVSLSWTAPDWCYPETPSATLNYGTGNVYYSWTDVYYAHRHLASNLAQYTGKAVYKVSTFIQYSGTYSLHIYTKSNSNNKPDPNSLEAAIGPMSISYSNAWYDFELSSPIILTGADDLWIVIGQQDTGQEYPSPSFNLSTYNANACYGGSSPTNLTPVGPNYPVSWFINTYLTDGTYTYNLYQDGTRIASNLTDTSYSGITLNDNAANQLVVKTNYYGGEAPSNMVGFVNGTASVGTLNMDGNDMMTLLANSILTIDGETSNSNSTHLVLENGAQLIHNTADVQATVKKTIEPYTADDNGWYFIASPIAGNTIPSENNGFLNGTPGQNNNTYDLYYYDEPSQQWKNYESQSFVIENKKGYLYANGETNGTTLQFSGTLSPSNESITINNLSHSATILNGFNLVGNPFACNATINQDCYVIEGSQVVLATTAPVLAPCEGVMVKATNECSSVTFTKASNSKGNNSKDCFDLVVTQGKTNVDRARVRLNEGSGMEKFSLDDKHSQISLWQDGQDFAVAYVNGATEMPVNFKANKNGTYTLTLEAGNFDLDYLHLIDNLTGNDVDLLSTPSYTFEAKTTDYTSRFRLVFSNYEDTVGDNETFAYFNDGNIVVNEEGTLQIVDMTGRVIVSRSGRIQCVPTTGMASGVYVLRLINTDGVKTQKIVVE